MKTDAEALGNAPPLGEAPSVADPWGGATIRAWSDGEPVRSSPWQPGVRVDRYELIEQIGAGGMAVVWSARDIDLGREVAIKLIRGSGGWPFAGQRGRLLREARAMARLSHSNVVTVHDVGTTHEGLFIVMERLDGGTLAEWLRAEPRSCGEVVANFIAAGRGLAEAHRAGLVHRDFKPDNVLMGRDGVARVSDFGLAFPVGEMREGTEQTIVDGEQAFTQDGTAAGTLAYMAPEQLLGENVTARSDQFSFCVALHEALYAVKPFRIPSGDAPAAAFLSPIVERRLATVPPGREVPTRLREITLRGLATDPNERWPSMDALVAELEFCLTQRGRRSWAELFEPLGQAPALDPLALGTAPTMQQPAQELLVQAVSTARRAEALAMAVANRQRPSLFLLLLPLAMIVAAGTAIAWTVTRSSRHRPAPVVVAHPPPAQVEAMPADWQGSSAATGAPVADQRVATPDAPALPGLAEASAEPDLADRTSAANEVARGRRRDPGRRRLRREPPDRAERRRDDRVRPSTRDEEQTTREAGGDRDGEEGTGEDETAGGEATSIAEPAAAPLDPAPAAEQETVDQPARTGTSAMPRRNGPITVAASRAKRESGGDRPIQFPAGEQVPREVVAKLCIDRSGSVTSVTVLSRVSPSLRTAIERALSRWRYQPIVEGDEKVAACFATGFPVRVE